MAQLIANMTVSLTEDEKEFLRSLPHKQMVEKELSEALFNIERAYHEATSDEERLRLLRRHRTVNNTAAKILDVHVEEPMPKRLVEAYQDFEQLVEIRRDEISKMSQQEYTTFKNDFFAKYE
ncbi:MAG: hypothetical protein MJD61_00745 [Proteobacteria bacterium]|nr:hypothetical protein [Pseudomonadota bacterium]